MCFCNVWTTFGKRAICVMNSDGKWAIFICRTLNDISSFLTAKFCIDIAFERNKQKRIQWENKGIFILCSHLLLSLSLHTISMLNVYSVLHILSIFYAFVFFWSFCVIMKEIRKCGRRKKRIIREQWNCLSQQKIEKDSRHSNMFDLWAFMFNKIRHFCKLPEILKSSHIL